MKIKLAYLQAAVQIPAVMVTESTLSSSKIPGLEMDYSPIGLLITVKGQRALIPSTNVKVMVLADDEVEAPKEVTKRGPGRPAQADA